MNLPWYIKNLQDIYTELKSGKEGITQNEAVERLKRDGPNKLPDAKVDSVFIIFLRQFKSPLIYVLVIASIIIFALGEYVDGSIIVFILFFNSIIGTIQEGKAQNTLLALKNYATTNATVIRDGKEVVIPDYDVVAGDVVVLAEGGKIPADCRIIEANNLTIDEAALTGESIPVNKEAGDIDKENLQTGDQKNMVFKGTNIVAGKGVAIVVATALNTEFGKISKEISEVDSEIPLKANIRYLSRFIIIFAIAVCVSVFIAGIIIGNSLTTMFTIAVSLAIAVIPEGLPIVMTLILATGVWRMSKRNALVKKLQAVEGLGQAQIIAVDKTGTLTANELVLKKLFINNKTFDVTGNGYSPEGEILLENKKINFNEYEEVLLAGKIAALGSDTGVSYDEERKTWVPAGDPTDGALSVFAKKAGFEKLDLEKKAKLISEIPFNSKDKFHVKSLDFEGKTFTTVIGAPEKLLELSNKYYDSGEYKELNNEKKEEFEKLLTKMYEEGLRVIAFGLHDGEQKELKNEDIKDLVFAGAYGFIDPLRPEIKDAVEKAHSAGIKIIMITGDHKITAQSIANEIGIYKEGDKVLSGSEIDEFSDQEFLEVLPRVSVFARVTPKHKMKIVEGFKKLKKVIAMTGDGVNDAPPLVAADLGIAMGKIGTEVAKEAADIILLDDNFASIIAAVEEGRGIYKTFKKVILYLFSTNLGEVLVIVAAILLGFPLPLLAAQILWLNFVTDAFLDVALSMDPKEDGLLKENFERPKKWILDKLSFQRIFIMAVTMMVGSLWVFATNYEADIVKAWTLTLTVMAVYQWFNVWNVRSENKSIFAQNPFSNKYLVGATMIVVLLQLFVVYNPFMQKHFNTTALNLQEWGVIILIASSIVLVEEIRKFIYRRRHP
jgi:P-type Ca2+ transporter type 2C